MLDWWYYTSNAQEKQKYLGVKPESHTNNGHKITQCIHTIPEYVKQSKDRLFKASQYADMQWNYGVDEKEHLLWTLIIHIVQILIQ